MCGASLLLYNEIEEIRGEGQLLVYAAYAVSMVLYIVERERAIAAVVNSSSGRTKSTVNTSSPLLISIQPGGNLVL